MEPNKSNKIKIIFYAKHSLLLMVACGLFIFSALDNRVSAGGPIGGLLPSDPLSIAAGSLIPGFNDLYCTVNPGETWVAGAVGYNICSGSSGGGGATYSPTGSGGSGGGGGYGGACGIGGSKNGIGGCNSNEDKQHCGDYINSCGALCGGSGPCCTPKCGCATNLCQGKSCSDGCGGSCPGKKAPTYTKTCVYSDTGNACNQSNCNQTIKIKSAYCTNVPNNGCGSQYTLPISQCSSFVSCHDQYTTCPPCSWKEVAP